ncbi:GAP family protein [Mycolicibacterium sp. S2-37]|uniref:GAP family protein n=1 Tax=Mycolicibacterium sp. S2-37 TaxID=2810297 RepID=UPI001A950227|nr:GAP family protein [Mycolicibacterium sp. S2-37]MBO0678424.1 GAP family protein [Mycolicibacterium sp. S2-37]
MWLTLLMMAAVVSLEPFRIGLTVLMLNRPRPLLQLSAFLAGAFVMGVAGGLVVLFVFRPALPDSTHFTLPRVQIGIGVLALLVAAVLAVWCPARRTDRPPRDIALLIRARRLLSGHSPWLAAVVGLGMALPSIDYLAVLAMILASGTSVATQIAAVLVFNVAALALVEAALVVHLVAPERTRAAMTAINDWIRSRTRRDVAMLLAVVGFVLIAVGFAGS